MKSLILALIISLALIAFVFAINDAEAKGIEDLKISFVKDMVESKIPECYGASGCYVFDIIRGEKINNRIYITQGLSLQDFMYVVPHEIGHYYLRDVHQYYLDLLFGNNPL